MKPLCIYHGNCADGFAAAWVVRKYFKKTLSSSEFNPATMPGMPEFIAGVYQTSSPDCKDRDVIIVDFSYKRAVMEKIFAQCKSLTWIDHHKSAIEDLSPWIKNVEGSYSNNLFTMRFTVERSGSMLTWNYYFPYQEPPQLLKHIEDRDLWKFDIPGTREIQANLFSYPYDFEVWDNLFEDSQKDLCANLYKGGHAIERKHFKDIYELLNIYTRWMIIGGVQMPVANLPYTMSSDAGHILAENAKNGCAACYSDGPDGRIFSLRSNGKEGSQDVSEIAKMYGGGGHRNAAGFRVDYETAKCFEIHPEVAI